MVRKDEFMGIPVLVATHDPKQAPDPEAVKFRERMTQYMEDRSQFLRSVDETTRARMSARPAARDLATG